MPDAPPPWLAQILQRVDARMDTIESRLAALSLRPGTSQPPPLPEEVSSPAFEALLEQPQLPPDYRTFLVPLATAFAKLSATLTTTELQTFQDAYTQARISVLTPVPNTSRPPSPPQDHSRSRTPTRYNKPGCFVHNGTTFYRSRSGKVHDTTKPPPYPCSRCGDYHWHLTPCGQKNGGPSSLPGSSLGGPYPRS